MKYQQLLNEDLEYHVPNYREKLLTRPKSGAYICYCGSGGAVLNQHARGPWFEFHPRDNSENVWEKRGGSGTYKMTLKPMDRISPNSKQRHQWPHKLVTSHCKIL